MCFSFLFLRKVNGFQPVDRSSDQWSDNLFSTPMFGVVVAQYAKFVFKRQSCADAEVMNNAETRRSNMRCPLSVFIRFCVVLLIEKCLFCCLLFLFFVINLIILSATNIAKNEQKDFQNQKKLPLFKVY